MADQDAESVVGTERIASFHHVPVPEGQTIRLGPGERVMSVEYNAEGGWFYAIVMQEFPTHSDGPGCGSAGAVDSTGPRSAGDVR